VQAYGANMDWLNETVELIMLFTLLDQLAAAQLASAQLAAFQLAAAQLAESNTLEPVSGLVATNLYSPAFGFGGSSTVDATRASISPTPAALPLTFGREFAASMSAPLT